MKKCKRCSKPSEHLGPISGTCHDCQNNAVADLEAQLGMASGKLGRVDSDLHVHFPKRVLVRHPKLRMAKANRSKGGRS